MHPCCAKEYPMISSLKSDKAEEEAIVEKIYLALVNQRLAPGTKLSESSLCKVFGVGRMRIRRVLLLLANRELVELQPNKGAYVARPSPKQAQEVFEARLLIEPSLARIAASNVNSKDLKTLEKHLLKESAAHASGDRHEAIRLSGEFHGYLAELSDNLVLLRVVKDLITRSSLIIGMFGEKGVVNCRDDEHAGIIQALRSGDASLVEELMRRHIDHLCRNIDFGKARTTSDDLAEVFKE